MQKLFITIAVLLSCQSFGQKTDVLETAQLEVKAIAHQLILELKSNPPLELSATQLNQMQESVEKIGLDRSLYAIIREPRVRTALVYRLLLKAIGLDNLSEALPNRYLAAHGFKSEIAVVLNERIATPDWFGSFEKVFLQRCEVSIHLHNNQMYPTDGNMNLKYGYAFIAWRDGIQIFNIQLSMPVSGEKNFLTARLMSLINTQQQFSDTNGAYDNVSDIKVNLMKVSDHSMKEMRQKMIVKTALDPKSGHYMSSREIDDHGDTFYDALADGQILRSTYTSHNVKDMVSQGYEIPTQTTICTNEKKLEDDFKFDPAIRSMIDTFRPVAFDTEKKRQAWLECLAKSTSEECQQLEASYKEATEVRAATWEKLKAIPIPNHWLVQVAKTSAPTPAADEKVQESAPVANPSRPEVSDGPFVIPNRECRYIKRGSRYMAYCDGNMSCNYESQELAVCSNGMKCHSENGQVHCN